MFRNNKLNLILALIIAVVLWAYVIGEINPTTNKLFSDIPISYANQEQLWDRGLAISSISDDTTGLTVKGERSKIHNVVKEDLSAFVDMTQGQRGSNLMKVRVRTPEGVFVDNKHPGQVTVDVETLIKESKPVKAIYSGEQRKNSEPMTLSISEEKISISGARTNVNRVEYLKAEINGEKLTEGEQTVSIALVPVDKNGNKVPFINMETDVVDIKCILAKTKDVKIDIPLIGEKEGGKERIVSLPKSITIKGRADVISNIDIVKCKPIDLAQITENTDVVVEPILPDGVEVARESHNLKARISVMAIESKSFTFEPGEVKLSGLGQDLKAQLNDKIDVIIEGSKEQISSISKENIEISLDLRDLLEGKYSIKVSMKTDRKYKTMRIQPETVEVIIEHN